MRATSAVYQLRVFQEAMAKLQLGGVSPAVLQLMVGCAQGGVSVVCRMFGEQRSRKGMGAGEDE